MWYYCGVSTLLRRAAEAEFAARNIFVPDSLLSFYDQFVGVDRDHNGMISEDEMAVRPKLVLLSHPTDSPPSFVQFCSIH